MIKPHKTGMTIDGKRMDLEYYLLNVAERPIPAAPTHYIVAEVINTDLSVKRVTIYFNPADTWKGNSAFKPNSPESIGLAISDGLAFLRYDPNTLAYQCWVMEISTDKVVLKSSTHSLTKCAV